MKRYILGAAAALAATVSMAPANAAVIVDAINNSSTGGVGANSGLILTTGQYFSISVATTDLWNAGALPRWSNADGLVGPLYSTGADDSLQPAATLIGSDFGLYSQDGYTAPYGALVGKIGTTYQLLGTSFTGPAWGTGALSLFYWDSNNGDNSGSISVTTAVPEPATWAMMIAGFAMIGFALRRRKTVQHSLGVRFA